jgi:hypothetical protein
MADSDIQNLGSGLGVVMLDECRQFDTNKSRRIQAANR